MRTTRRGFIAAGLGSTLITLLPSPLIAPLMAEVITLKNGYQLEGKVGRLSAIAQDPLKPASDGPESIVLIDDDIRRVFVPFLQVKTMTTPERPTRTRIDIEQRVAVGGARIAAVGVPLKIEPFDEFGRRTFSMSTADGAVHVIQGMTQVNSQYIKLEGLVAEKSYVWTTKIPTSSVPASLLSKILRRQAGDDVDRRLAIVRLYIEAERYSDAQEELKQFEKDFPQVKVDTLRQNLKVASAARMIKEIQMRRDAGQHLLAMSMCNNFPLDNAAGVTREEIRDILTGYSEQKMQGDRVMELFDKHLAELPNDKQKEELAPIRTEIAAELSIHNLERFADYLRLSDDPNTKADQKLSLAISGWLVGKGEATENLSVAIALHGVRNLVRDYLNSTHEGQRAQILSDLEKYEGGSPRYIARLLANMKPPADTEPKGNIPGYFELDVPGLKGEANVKYHVQLPPEYNPYRKYPCVVTLNGAITTPQDQIAWWCGDYHEGHKIRMGQASRRGYIVIAPEWTRKHQAKYEYSAQEHAAVLFSLRDAMQRFSIDSDKVFLSGYSMGGDAAWDISLAHPDLWAGVIPIGATTEKYVLRYYENGKAVPLYYIAGEMDGDRFAKCAQVLDKYLKYTGYDAVVVQYQGRGHEHFYDDIQNIFGWMEFHRRDPLPKKIDCVSMRPWDNFFWWVELEHIPSDFTVLPAAWPAKNVKNAFAKAEIKSPTSISLQTSDRTKMVLYLTPEMVNFENKFTVTFNGKPKAFNTQPSVAVLLEDARTRGDRQHPYWQKLEFGK
jgi:predicted esterase